MKKIIHVSLVLFIIGQWLFNVVPYSLALPQLGNQQIYRATSVDGLTFTAGSNLLLDQASSPSAVLHGGEVWVYFINEQPGQEGLTVARQNSGSYEILNQVKLDSVLANQVANPKIISLSDGRYRLFYDNGSTLMSAVSNDGLNFSSESGVVKVEAGRAPTAVQLADGHWLMAFVKGTDINFATSADGNAFLPNAVTVSTTGGTPALMALAEGQVRLLVGQETLKSYLSKDGGQTWTPENPSASIVNQNVQANGTAQPAVLAMPDGTWSLFYVMTAKPTPTTSINGVVKLQGRTDFSGTQIAVNGAGCTSFSDKPVVTTEQDGRFSITAEQTYQCLQAKHAGYLIGQKKSPAGDVGTIILLGGDVNGDNEINIFDLALVAAGYDSHNAQLDLTGDGLVDIFDLTVAAVNYGKRGQ